jgi:hypothetical protein
MSRGARSPRLRCTAGQQCDFHADGGAAAERCPGQCDARDCTADGFYEVSSERTLCALHAAVVLLARALAESLAADNAADDATGGR